MLASGLMLRFQHVNVNPVKDLSSSIKINFFPGMDFNVFPDIPAHNQPAWFAEK